MKEILDKIFNEYKNLPQVQAIAIGGSARGKYSDASSDIDVYVFVDTDIPVEVRENIVKKYSSRYEVGGEYFGSGDEFMIDSINRQLDVMFWNTQWFKDVIDNVWIKNYPSNGYTTCFVYTLKNLSIIYDKDNFLQNLKDKINSPYPQNLKRNIIKRNLMLLKDKPFASYYEQIEKAVKRNDINSINHRTAAFLASYFDILFAANEILHPGEKRLIRFAKDNCKMLPENFEENLNRLLVQPNPERLLILSDMVEKLKRLLNSEV